MMLAMSPPAAYSPAMACARFVEDLGVLVDLESGEGAEAAGLDFHGIERALFDRRDARVGLLQRITLLAVVGRRTATELRVFAVARVAVVVATRCCAGRSGRCRRPAANSSRVLPVFR